MICGLSIQNVIKLFQNIADNHISIRQFRYEGHFDYNDSAVDQYPMFYLLMNPYTQIDIRSLSKTMEWDFEVLTRTGKVEHPLNDTDVPTQERYDFEQQTVCEKIAESILIKMDQCFNQLQWTLDTWQSTPIRGQYNDILVGVHVTFRVTGGLDTLCDELFSNPDICALCPQ